MRFRAGDKWWIDSLELNAVASEEQQQRYDEDPWQQLIENWVQDRDHVTVNEILNTCIQKLPKDWNQSDKNRIARCLRAIGWTRKRGSKDEQGKREWRHYPGPGPEERCPTRLTKAGTPQLIDSRDAVPVSHFSQ